ncbi:MAG: hypothetical protein QOF64_158 [Candidatus Binatota bacterium]|nr:hypothetical protein [Candidatus Binatota bacterium]
MNCVRTEGNSIGTGESTGVIGTTVPGDASLPAIAARFGRIAVNWGTIVEMSATTAGIIAVGGVGGRKYFVPDR